MGKKLTEKQWRFVKEYIIDGNATRSAKAAGYSEKSAHSIGEENLKKPEIMAALDEEREKRCVRLQIDQDWVLKASMDVYHRCMQKTPVLDKDGYYTGEWKFEPAAANKALDQIAKHVHVKAYNDQNNSKKELTIVNISKDMTAQEASELYKEFIKSND